MVVENDSNLPLVLFLQKYLLLIKAFDIFLQKTPPLMILLNFLARYFFKIAREGNLQHLGEGGKLHDDLFLEEGGATLLTFYKLGSTARSYPIPLVLKKMLQTAKR